MFRTGGPRLTFYVPSKLHEMINIGEEALETLKAKEMIPPRSSSKRTGRFAR